MVCCREARGSRTLREQIMDVEGQKFLFPFSTALQTGLSDELVQDSSYWHLSVSWA